MKEIIVLGPGCAKCEELLAQTKAAVAELGLDIDVQKVSDITQIASYGVMITPALVIDGEVKFSGKVPALDKLKELLTN